MGRLTRPRAADSIRPVTIDRFGGYDRRPGAGDGAIWDEMNIWGGAYPALESRPPMTQVKPEYNGVEIKPYAVFAQGGFLYMFVLSGIYARLYRLRIADGTVAALGDEWETGSADYRYFAAIADKICVFPDMMVYDTAKGVLAPMNEEWDQPDNLEVTFEIFTPARSRYFGIRNATMRFAIPEGDAFPFREGDTVTVACSDAAYEEDEKPDGVIIREVIRNKSYAYLIFAENTFTKSGTPTTESVTVERSAPAVIAHAVECNGRLWGYHGNFIYASALNDPFNWSRFDGLSTDSWSCEAPGEGEITGVVSFQGAPVYFKDTGIIRVYGSIPTEFTASMTACVGARAGNARSICVVGPYVYYNSRAGVMRWGGSSPVFIGQAFGGKAYRYGYGGTDGIRLYMRLTDSESAEQGKVWMFDPALGEWFRYDGKDFDCFSFDGTLWAKDAAWRVWVIGEGAADLSACTTAEEDPISTSVIFGDFDGSYGSYSSRSYYGRKGVSRVDLRLTLDAGVTARVWIRYDGVPVEGDNDADWQKIGETAASAAEKRTVRVPIVPRRCDHFALRITTAAGANSTGHWLLHSMTIFKYQGTDIH